MNGILALTGAFLYPFGTCLALHNGPYGAELISTSAAGDPAGDVDNGILASVQSIPVGREATASGAGASGLIHDG